VPYVQRIFEYDTTFDTTTVLTGWGQATVRGNAIIVAGSNWDAAKYISGVSDDLGNVYREIAQATDSTRRACMWAAYNIAGGSPTVTVTWSTTSNVKYATAVEYQDVVGLIAATTHTEASSVPGTNLALPASGPLGLESVYYHCGATSGYTPGTGLTERTDSGGGGITWYLADGIVNTVAGFPPWTSGSAISWAAIAAAFQLRRPESPPRHRSRYTRVRR
jgi:hypothetical protein